MSKKSLLGLLVLAIALLFSACKGPCDKYVDLSCKDADSQMCANAKAAVKNMKAEECKNGVQGLESQQAFEDPDFDEANMNKDIKDSPESNK